ncbi:hypothetical protein [Vibrio sp. F74]|uniref:hypothetical protein n=1 Tax=Vibrio sp. F74 TaxID=700020 RepID=UPI0035F56FDF
MNNNVSKNIFNLIIILFSVVIYLLIPYQTSDLQVSYVSSRAFPTLLCQALFVVAVTSGLYDFFTSKSGCELRAELISGQAIAVYSIMLLSVIAMFYIGFNIAITIGSVLILATLRLKKVYAYVLIPIIVYFISYIFTTFLYIELPTGVL